MLAQICNRKRMQGAEEAIEVDICSNVFLPGFLLHLSQTDLNASIKREIRSGLSQRQKCRPKCQCSGTQMSIHAIDAMRVCREMCRKKRNQPPILTLRNFE